ncbi:MAG: 50S ribosomal protein L24 [Erysipelotrichaceae bacterium]|nr:50S ribosomal protein L24 [Erysipelotrichaceae bacterium]
MKIKKGDKVQVIAGKDKGITGEVLAVYPDTHKVVVEGVNILKKHVRPSQANPEGGIQSQEAPIDVSNVMAYDTKAKKAGRVGYVFEGGEKVRINKKSGNKIKDAKK